MRIVTSKQRREISQFFEETQETARTAFERDGVCVPVAIFMCEEGNTVLPLHRKDSAQYADRVLDLFSTNDVLTVAGHRAILEGWATIEAITSYAWVTPYARVPSGGYALPPRPATS